MLAAMGFGGEDAAAALARFKGSVERAADWLLQGRPEVPGGAGEGPAGAGAGGAGGAGAAGERKEQQERLEKVLEEVVGGLAPDWGALSLALRTMMTVLGNVLKHPGDEKYRRVRLGNASFRERVGKHRGTLRFLGEAGLQRAEGGEEALEYRGGDAERLRVACRVLEVALAALPAA